MAVLSTEDISITALVTLMSCWQMATFAKAVGAARRKYSITPPAIDGNPNFVRIFRAQQNSIEFFGIFLGVLWVASLFFHQYPASLMGLVYLYGRRSYFYGYAEDTKKRLSGFQLCVIALQGLLGLSALGIIQTLIAQYLGFNVKTFLRQTLNL